MRAAVTARARMILGIGVYAAGQARSLVRMTVLALYLRNLFRMRVFLDVRVAIVALQIAVKAFAEHLAIDSNAFPIAVRHACIAMT